MEDFLTDMVDNILNLLASTRYVSAGHSTSVKTEVTVPAVVLGSKTYAIAILVISILALLIYLIVALSTYLWREMIELDFTDMAQVISIALVGGSVSAAGALARLTTDGSRSRFLLTVRGDGADAVPILEAFAEDADDEKPESNSSFNDTTQQTLPLGQHSHGDDHNVFSDDSIQRNGR